MNATNLNGIHWDEPELIASFGEAQIVRRLNGKFELRGGSSHERAEAREWVSMFLHEAVFNGDAHRVPAAPQPGRLLLAARMGSILQPGAANWRSGGAGLART